MYLFSPDVFFTWFGFWQFVGMMYVFMLSMILVIVIIRRKEDESFQKYMREKYHDR